ncbi:hypothetical protein CERZMDRAFT_90402 [Cercospora zeae-maydis SCOH1-5]|uniref:Uncharacterized protein n=1 Tax=Cercospora zeae-maydis SCOH1-5 TaxID=717836 RepID=A0A6A6FKJ1_9PEZI|nr:hypothetical protein CERZMDRAFT_90402 [Cercospora zeae-maydis SCOH1-5]
MRWHVKDGLNALRARAELPVTAQEIGTRLDVVRCTESKSTTLLNTFIITSAKGICSSRR